MKLAKCITLVVASLLFACSQKPKNLEEYRSWFNVEQNGFLKKRIVKELKFQAKFLPVDLMVLNELGGQSLNKKDLDSLKKSYGNGKYFLFSVGLKDDYGPQAGDLLKNYANSIKEYAEVFESLAFDLKDHFTLEIDGEEHHPSIYHYEQGAHLTSEQRFLIAFDVPKNSKKGMTFIYQDELFEVGRLKFHFDIQKNNIPSIPIKEFI